MGLSHTGSSVWATAPGGTDGHAVGSAQCATERPQPVGDAGGHVLCHLDGGKINKNAKALKLHSVILLVSYNPILAQ